MKMTDLINENIFDIFDFSGKEMEEKYVPFAYKIVSFHPKKTVIKKLMKAFPKIKPTDAHKAYKIAFNKKQNKA